MASPTGAACASSIQWRYGVLEQLGLLVLGGGIEPEAVGLHREVPTVLADPAFAHVEHLLAGEQRVHDRRPFLVRGCHVSRIRCTWTTASSPETSASRRTSRRRRPRRARSGWCCATACRMARAARRQSATPIPTSRTASPARRDGSCSRSTSAARARRKATSPRGAGSTTCTPRCACSTRATTFAVCGRRASVTVGRSRCAKPPKTRWCAASPRSPVRTPCSIGHAIPDTSWNARATWA